MSAIALMLTACASAPGKVSSSSKGDDSRPTMVVKQNYKISSSVEQQFAHGIEAMSSEDYVQAIEIFKKVAEKEPRASGPWVNIAIAYRKLDQIDKADEAIETAVKLNPKNPYALNQAGIIKRENGSFEEAQAMYKNALAEYPNYANAHLNLAILCDLYLQKIVCAKSHYQAYQEIEKNDDKQVIAWINDLSRRESQIK
ncbi:MAG: tetratricopeptide repeat protein [Gammaproteobacteria bacterium]|nr:tetratricopeptide repeat protein [Gammaproteobacteria bacterium]